MIGRILGSAAKLFIGGKFHWRTILSGFALLKLMRPRPRMNPAYAQMMMYQQMRTMNPMMMNPMMMNPMMMGRYF